MDEELEGRLEEVNRLVQEIKEEGKKAELARIRFAHFQCYAAGQHDAWETVKEVIYRLKDEPIEEEEDGH